jgi:uncharacterized protein YggL (DUF469 family)
MGHLKQKSKRRVKKIRKLKKNNAVDPFQKLIGSVTAGPNQAAKHDEAIYE